MKITEVCTTELKAQAFDNINRIEILRQQNRAITEELVKRANEEKKKEEPCEQSE